MSSGQDDHLDGHRIHLLISLLIFRLSSFVPWPGALYENVPFALKHLSCAILGVRALSNDITEAIQKLNVAIRFVSLVGGKLVFSSVCVRVCMRVLHVCVMYVCLCLLRVDQSGTNC